ncbi:MAG TPA: hypothetical protein VKQ32_22065 [Polyangia bacterium]|nr:hypothetical protein [Polyangia bacterium]
MWIFRPTVAVGVMALVQSGCRGCDEGYQKHQRDMSAREGVCYAMPLGEAAKEVRAVLAGHEFPLPPAPADDPAFIATGWKDTTVYASRLTFKGRPARARREVLLAGGTCLRFAVRAISQSTPKEGPDYADTIFGSYDEDSLSTEIDARLHAHARPWQPPP